MSVGSDIHPTAVVHEGARLGEGVQLGPYAVVGDGVVLGDRCRVEPQAYLQCPLVTGADCVLGFSSAVGTAPQMKGPSKPFGGARLGDRVVLREFAQVHRSASPDGETVIADDVFMMANAHIGHDCRIGTNAVLANHVCLGGHVVIEERAFLAGGAVLQQFVRIGELAMVGGLTGIQRDIPPFCMVTGIRPRTLVGLNKVGLRRAGLSGETRKLLNAAYRALFRSDLPIPERLERVEITCPEVERLVRFCRESERGVVGLSTHRD